MQAPEGGRTRRDRAAADDRESRRRGSAPARPLVPALREPLERRAERGWAYHRQCRLSGLEALNRYCGVPYGGNWLGPSDVMIVEPSSLAF